MVKLIIRYSNNRGRDAGILETEKCALHDWSTWSSCSATCGDSHKTRSRNFKYKKHLKECKSIPNGPVLQETIACEYVQCPDMDKDEVSESPSQEEENKNNEQDNDNEEDYEGEAPVMEVTEKWQQVQNLVYNLLIDN